MRIISTVWALFDYKNNNIEVLRNGGSIMIYDICEYIGRIEESYVFIGNCRTKNDNVGSVHVLDNRKYLPPFRDVNNINQWQEGLQRRFKELLIELKPDFVLVHGGLDFSTNCIHVCMELDQPYAYVNHLGLSGNAGYKMPLREEEWERKLYSIPKINIISVGNGMRNKILRENKQLSISQVHAIPNGSPLVGDKSVEYGRPDRRARNKKTLLCSGSLQPRKNQLQLVEAFRLLPDKVRNNVKVLFCGNYSEKNGYKDALINRIESYGLKDSLQYMGVFSRDEMIDIYSSVDGLVIPSLSEGLSLVAIEMIAFGKPVIMFYDNETAGDLNDNKAVILIPDHTNEALAQGITEWYVREWDSKYIRDYSQYYNMDRVAEDYIAYINQLLHNDRVSV